MDIDSPHIPKVGVANAQAVNSAEFWNDWALVGGDPDEYVKESVPNYGLIGALLLTVSLSATLSPPPFTISGTAYESDWFVSAFVILMNMSTTCSVALILYSVQIYTQYVNCTNKALRLNFCKKYGFVVGILVWLLILDFVSLFLAILVTMIATYEHWATILSILILAVGLLAVVVHVMQMMLWNANYNYGKAMKEMPPTSNATPAEELRNAVSDLKAALSGVVDRLEALELATSRRMV